MRAPSGVGDVMRSARMRAVLAQLAGLAIWSAGTGAWACVEHTTKDRGSDTQVRVPGVAGDPERIAVECLRRYGFTPYRGGSISSSQPRGTVAFTVPAEGAAPKTRKAAPVTYWVSSGEVASGGATSTRATTDEAAPRSGASAEADTVPTRASPSRGSQRTVKVPALDRKTLSAAKIRLKWSRLRLGEVIRKARGGEEGRVVGQVPAAGTPVAADTRVDVVVSTGRLPITVPDVVGQSELRALGDFAKARVDASSRGRVNSPLPAGTVTRTDPVAGSEALAGTVAYWVASGQNVVPDLRGSTREAAVRTLRASGFAVGNAPSRFDDGKPNRVIGQKPAAGTVASVDTRVSVWLSKPRVVPRIVGQPERDARKALAAAGLKGVNVGEEPSSMQGGRVSSSEPRAGARVRENATVRYRLAAQAQASAADDGAGQDGGAAAVADATAVPRVDTPPAIREASTPLHATNLPAGDSATTVRQGATHLTADAFTLAQRAWKVAAGSTTLALVLAGVWWTQLRSWPWHWPPPRPRMHVRIKPARSPWPLLGPLDHAPELDLCIRHALVPGAPIFAQPLPVLDTEIRHD